MAVLGLLVFVTLSIGGLAIAGVVITRLPADYFSNPASAALSADRHPAARWAILLLKNIVGAAIVVLGIILTLPGVPGPGVLTILLGIMLMDFPGKKRLERWLIGRPRVLHAVNRLRHRYGKAPFLLGEP